MEKQSGHGIRHLLHRAAVKARRRRGVLRLLKRTGQMALFSAPYFWVYAWIPPVSRRMHPQVTVSKFGRAAVFTPKDYHDLEVWRDIFELEDYADDPGTPPAVIFDLGAHVGLSTLYYRLKYPDARIFSFEADPGNFEYLRRNVAAFDNVQASNYALSVTDRTVRLYVHPRSVSHSMVERASDQQYVDVQGKSLDAIVRELGLPRVDLIKFNIEGMEREVLGRFSLRNEVGCYNGHLHLDLIDMTQDEFSGLFEGYDIRMRETKPQRFKFYAKKRAAAS